MGEFRTHSTSHRHRRGRQHRRRAPIPAATWPSDPETPGHIHSPVRRIADRRHRHQPGQHPAAATPTNPLPGQPPLPPIRPGHATPTRNPTQRCVNISTLAADPSHRHPPPPVAAPRPPSAKPTESPPSAPRPPHNPPGRRLAAPVPRKPHRRATPLQRSRDRPTTAAPPPIAGRSVPPRPNPVAPQPHPTNHAGLPADQHR
ncbi:Uncharacterised protein [Mycobacterium tuberculosis]|nr:Uncharacterised protein [Mycobacterium tuberculosis]CNU48583.1 Uncharacterised protein [Mycobacterium tuberculosis]CNU49638.1 Uncharacterised protein [Mycobacterium tuberculosis]COW44888.1 Uncharacterised protein [Mycobacterium tuberculosis]